MRTQFDESYIEKVNTITVERIVSDSEGLYFPGVVAAEHKFGQGERLTCHLFAFVIDRSFEPLDDLAASWCNVVPGESDGEMSVDATAFEEALSFEIGNNAGDAGL